MVCLFLQFRNLLTHKLNAVSTASTGTGSEALYASTGTVIATQEVTFLPGVASPLACQSCFLMVGLNSFFA